MFINVPNYALSMPVLYPTLVLSTGYNTALDACGGHVHDGLAYHYHAQIFTATSVNKDAPAGSVLYATTPGTGVILRTLIIRHYKYQYYTNCSIRHRHTTGVMLRLSHFLHANTQNHNHA